MGAIRQNKTWLTAATLAPILHLAAGIPWYLTILLSLLAAALRRISGRIRNPWARRGVFWAAAGEALLLLEPCWPGQRDLLWVLTILWILSLLTCRKEREILQDAALLLWWLVAFLLGSVLFSGALELKLPNLLKAPEGIPWKKAAALLGILTLPAVLDRPGEKGGTPEAYLTLFPGILSVLVQGVLGVGRAITVGAPFYEMSRSIRLYGLFDRMEALGWLGMLLGTYLYFTMVLCGSTMGLEQGNRRKLLFLAAGLGLLPAFLKLRTSGLLLVAVLAFGGIADWLLGKIRGRKKKEEK